MRRVLFNFAAGFSLVVFVLAVVFAIRGIWRSDWVSLTGVSACGMVSSLGSSCWFSVWLDAPTGASDVVRAGSEERLLPYFDPTPENGAHFLGLSFMLGRTSPNPDMRLGGNRPYYTLIVPHWMMALLAAMLPALWLRKVLRRQAAGHCPKCGYDLRATPERCPECGYSVAEVEGLGRA